MTFEIAFWSLFVGIIGSLTASYIYPYIGNVFGKLSNSYQQKRLKDQERRNKQILDLANNETLLIIASSNAQMTDIVFFLTFIIYLLLPPVSLLNMVASLCFGFLSMVAAYRGSKKRRLINDAVKAYKAKSFTEKDL